MAKPATERELAARAVALNDNEQQIPPHQTREVLDMLGLLTPDGRSITEEPPGLRTANAAVRTINSEFRHRSTLPMTGEQPVKNRSTVPSGLRKIPGLEQ